MSQLAALCAPLALLKGLADVFACDRQLLMLTVLSATSVWTDKAAWLCTQADHCAEDASSFSRRMEGGRHALLLKPLLGLHLCAHSVL